MSDDKQKAAGQSKQDTFAAAVLKIGGKIGNQRHFVAIRDGFGTFLPLVIVGAMAVMINSVFIHPDGLLATIFNVKDNATAYANWQEASFYLSPIFVNIAGASLNFFAVYMAALFGYFVAQSYGDKPIHGALIGLASFLLLDPLAAGLAASGNNMQYIGSVGIIYAMVGGLAGPTIFHYIAKNEKLRINVPDGVPPAVGSSFSALIPFTLTLLAFGAIQPIWGAIAHASKLDEMGGDVIAVGSLYYIVNVLQAIIVTPLYDVAGTWWAITIVFILMGMFWFVGIHGTNVMSPIVEGVWGVMTIANIDLYNNTLAAGGTLQDVLANPDLYLWTKASMDAYVMIGGSGATFALICGVLAFSKNDSTREISKLSAAPGAFNINEPMIYGTPLVMNFVYAIPFIFVNVIQAWVVLAFLNLGWLRPTLVMVPWTTPVFFSGLFSTMFDWVSIVVTAITFAISFLVYLPFVFIDSKAQTNSDEFETKEDKK